MAQYLGLRVSEILALQWSDINFGELTMRVTRGGVDGVVDEVKTEYSEDELPLDPDLATVLLSWKEQCPKSEVGWMFPSRSPAAVTARVQSSRTTYVRLDRGLVSAPSGGTPSATRIAPGLAWSALRWVCSRN